VQKNACVGSFRTCYDFRADGFQEERVFFGASADLARGMVGRFQEKREW